MKKNKRVQVLVDKNGRIETAQQYLCVALTGDKKTIKKAIGKSIAKHLGFEDNEIKVALYYGYTDKNGKFQAKPLKEILNED